MPARHATKLYAAISGLIVLAGCWGGLARPTYSRQTADALEPVPFPPPPARVEYVPDRPKGDTVWIDGEWIWTGRAWSWKRGRWVVPPEGATFSPWSSVRSPDGMLYVASGTWRDAKGEEIDAPTAVAYGKPTAGAIVDSEGVSEHTGKSIKEEVDPADRKANKKKKNDAGADDPSDDAPDAPDVPEASGPPRVGPDGGTR